ncbi:hypothetical protein LCGC14_2274420 [marine sediment metagenome]|uniref:AP2/ERF domain-containing protein n=1 Tax=marine sediment metagenome TaxID=412755 RepID=A0A0F9FR33_9ZZZZ
MTKAQWRIKWTATRSGQNGHGTSIYKSHAEAQRGRDALDRWAKEWGKTPMEYTVEEVR